MALAKLGQLHLLRELHQQVLIPDEVHRETAVRGRRAGHADAYVVERAVSAGFLLVIEVGEQGAALPATLDRGERQAIWLATQQAPSLVMLDDLLARRVAVGLGLQVRGTLGVLATAWRAGLLSWPELSASITEAGRRPDIWIAAQLCEQLLAALRAERGAGQG